MRRVTSRGSLIGIVLIAGGLVGCADRGAPRTTTTAQAGAPPPPAAAEKEAPPPGAPPEAQRGMQRYELAYPTGDRETAAVLVEKFTPGEVRAGQRYTYTIRVTNLTDAPLSNVTINETAKGIEIEEGRPARTRVRIREPGRWVIGMLPPGATETIEVTAVARGPGASTSCLDVDYKPTLCTGVAVVNPQLQLRKAAPAAAYSCDQPSFIYEVTNTGTGTAQNVVIHERLPEGLTTADGRQEIMIPVGDLPAGKTAQHAVTVRPVQLGTFQSRAIARSQEDQTASPSTQLTIVQPELAVEIAGPAWQYADEPLTYQIRVTNVSNVPARDTELMLQTDAPLATSPERRLGTLAPGQSRTTTVTVQGKGDQVQLSAGARGSCAPLVSDRIVSEVRKVSALRIGTVDTQDPVKVGETTTYEVSVTNQGDAAAENVQVSARIPEGMTIVGVEGSTQPRVEGDRLILGPLPSLPAGQTAAWSVQARIDRPGVARFRTEVDGEFLDRPIPDEEPTRVIQAMR